MPDRGGTSMHLRKLAAACLVLVLGLLLARTAGHVPVAVAASTPSPSLYYRLDIVAQTGVGGLTNLGRNPSINDRGVVALTGSTAAGEAIFVGDGAAAVRNINPGSSSRRFGDSVQI